MVKIVEGVLLFRKAWPWVKQGAARPSGRWFGLRFMQSASVVVDRWGPRWARRRILAIPAGAWLLACLWVGLPILCLFAIW